MFAMFEVKDSVVGLNDVLKVSAVRADQHDVVPDLPVVVVTLDGLLQDFPGSGLLALIDIGIGQVIPCFKVLKS
jgi:hypothetical protein